MKVRILIIMIFMLLLTGCQNDSVFIEAIELELVEVTDQDTIDIMIDHLESIGQKGDIEGNIQVHKIRNNLPKSCYLVSLDYAYLKQLVVLEEEWILSSLPGGYYVKTYILDSDGDGELELMFQTEIGSGLRRILVSHYDFATGVVKVGNFYNKNDGLVFDLAENRIHAFSYYYEFDRKSEEPIGELLFKDTLEIENLDTF